MTWLYRLLPALEGAGRRTRAVGCAAVGATTAGLAAHALVTAAGAGGTPAGLLAPALCYLGAIVLLAYGVTLAQGFHIARPLPAAELERFVTGGPVVA